MQVVEQEPDTEILRTGSWIKLSKRIIYTDPHTEILPKRYYRILIHVQDPEKDPGSGYKKDPGTEILHKWSDRILMQVVQKDPDTDLDPDAEILQKWSYDGDTSGPKDPDTETLHKWSYSILI